MDLGFEQDFRQQMRAGPAGEERGDAAFDWAGLRARFAAAQACRQALAEPAAAASVAGSFDAVAARSLVSWEKGQRAVNPNALVDGKDAGSKDAGIADAPEPGDRGQ